MTKHSCHSGFFPVCLDFDSVSCFISAVVFFVVFPFLFFFFFFFCLFCFVLFCLIGPFILFCLILCLFVVVLCFCFGFFLSFVCFFLLFVCALLRYSIFIIITQELSLRWADLSTYKGNNSNVAYYVETFQSNSFISAVLTSTIFTIFRDLDIGQDSHGQRKAKHE